MEALNLNQKQFGTKQLRASEFPDPADVYVCDKCGRDITAHLHRGRAHVRMPLGPSRYICDCGQKYRSGTAEWDDLSDWDRRQRLADIGLAFIVLAALAGFSILVAFAVTHRRVALLVVLAIAALFSIPLLPLFIAILTSPFEIAASLWRTRISGGLSPK